jgi:hypothetical protein
MALSIKNDEAELLVRKLARSRNLSLTGAIRLAVGNELAKDPPPTRDSARMREEIRRIQERWAQHEPIDMKEMDAWMYDENGLPH